MYHFHVESKKAELRESRMVVAKDGWVVGEYCSAFFFLQMVTPGRQMRGQQIPILPPPQLLYIWAWTPYQELCKWFK